MIYIFLYIHIYIYIISMLRTLFSLELGLTKSSLPTRSGQFFPLFLLGGSQVGPKIPQVGSWCKLLIQAGFFCFIGQGAKIVGQSAKNVSGIGTGRFPGTNGGVSGVVWTLKVVTFFLGYEEKQSLRICHFSRVIWQGSLIGTYFLRASDNANVWSFWGISPETNSLLGLVI